MKDKNLKEQVDSLKNIINTLELVDEMLYEWVTKRDIAKKMWISGELLWAYLKSKDSNWEPRVISLKASNKIYKAITK